jgi:hypothetical protein
LLRIRVGIFAFLLVFKAFSLDVPPGSLALWVAMFGIAGLGEILSLRESRKWRVLWMAALAIALVGGALELVAGKRIAEQRSRHESSLTSTNR